MDIIIAKTAGFCFGVRRAVSIAEDTAKNNKNCVTLGPLIHNKSVTDRLLSMGVSEISSASEAKADDTIIIR